MISTPLSRLSEIDLVSNFSFYTEAELKRIAELSDVQCRKADMMFNEIGRKCGGTI